MPSMSSPRILIIRTDRMGDVILSTPVIRALRKALPDAHLAMMVRPEHRELVEGHPDLNGVILFDKEGEDRGLSGTLRLARRLRQEQFDTAVILHSTNRVILLAWLAGIRRRVGYARRLPWLLTDRLPYVKREGGRHEAEYNLELLKFLDIQADHPKPFVQTTPAQEAKVEAFLKNRAGGANSPLAVLHPGASCPSKRWPPERFSQVADSLIDECGACVVVVTGPEEIARGEQVARLMRNAPLRALGLFSPGELACLFKRSRCLVSNDSGPVHLAAAVGTPVVAIFGRWGGGLSPTRWGPLGDSHRILHHDVGCRPCLAHRCPIDFVCLKAVSVEEVLTAVEHAAGLVGKRVS